MIGILHYMTMKWSGGNARFAEKAVFFHRNDAVVYGIVCDSVL